MKKFLTIRIMMLVIGGGASFVGGGYVLNGMFASQDDRQESHVRVLVSAGHGSIIDNVYQTAGKQSPKWEDGTKIHEGVSTKALAYEIMNVFGSNQIDAQLLNPELEDVSLKERVIRANGIASRDTRAIFLALHHDAQRTQDCLTDYCDDEGNCGWYSTESGGASRISIYTSTGQTRSDVIAKYIANELELKFDIPVKVWEADFYVLRYTYCPALLIEFCFMTTKSDCDIITNPVMRTMFCEAVVEGIVKYNKTLN